jgi:predicted nucleotidyltransferase
MKRDRQTLEREVTAFLKSVNKYEIDVRGLDLTYYGEALAFAIPRFIQVLRDTGNACMQTTRHLISCTASILGSIGREARCAIPDLIRLLRFQDRIIRMSAFGAIVEIAEAFKEEPEVVDAIIEELESAAREMDAEIAQRETLIEELRSLLGETELERVNPKELDEKLHSQKWETVYWVSNAFLRYERQASERCRRLVRRFIALSETMLGREQLQDAVNEIEEKRRGGWQNMQEIILTVTNWASEKSPPIKVVYLFGSRVRKDFTPESDLDIAIKLQLPAGDDEREFWIRNVDAWCQELEQRLPYKIDLHWLKDAEQTPEILRGVRQGCLYICPDGDVVGNRFTSIETTRDS